MWGGVQRNYRFFLLFIFTTTALDVLVFVFAWLRLIWRVQHDPDQPSLGDAIVREPAAMFLVCFTFLAFWCVSNPALRSSLLHFSHRLLVRLQPYTTP